ncbi:MULTISPECIES: hypothetical protein [Herbaspirillum]|jgi:hypothetical protein|uniref:Uncharacterized protein n=1 Tax=Herbaspirillum rubrisubalbicans Os34 TaxID=1235827 RepID=A0A6M3ZQS0_9BURK|nr:MULTISPECIES: hypothetical protein [Herbaspirillum]MCP1572324.1 hypothetical protein [Herbaspirillum rubrisubalbicans]NQE50710.1 hypothetical protein [Herbaspirillum rubrisubalbicans]QJQ00957.1 hypothetical protein C798_12145 [Herbaspirillum rubrisubalbicans Os34]
MEKPDSTHPYDPSIAIPQGDWTAYRNHISSQASGAGEPEAEALVSFAAPGQDSAGQPLHGEQDILAYRRRCARAYIGMNGRLGGRAYRPNEPVILTQEAVQELAELNRLLREERAQKKKAG